MIGADGAGYSEEESQPLKLTRNGNDSILGLMQAEGTVAVAAPWLWPSNFGWIESVGRECGGYLEGGSQVAALVEDVDDSVPDLMQADLAVAVLVQHVEGLVHLLGRKKL